jgi:hypothetical protein
LDPASQETPADPPEAFQLNLSSGARLGFYELTAKLGEVGRGDVRAVRALVVKRVEGDDFAASEKGKRCA